MAKSRPRPAAVEALATPPPAKRRKPLSDAPSHGFASILLPNKAGSNANKKIAAAHATKSDRSNPSRLNDKNASVSTANGLGDVHLDASGAREAELVEISSDSSSDDDEDENEEDQEGAEVNGKINGASHEDSMGPQNDDGDLDAEMGEDGADGEEATFGERLHAQQDPIDVESALAKVEDDSSDETRKPARLPLAKALSGATFSSVLTQALNTNDNTLLESCFETTDLESVRETISRLDSRHIVSLLRRIAERISKRPGRLGNLMVWVQWSIIAHGGYLAGQPDIVGQLGTLTRVIKARADGLQPLLQLKGKLDMLAAQIDLRRDVQERHARDEEDEEDAVTVYVEGEEEEELSSDEESDGRHLLLKDVDELDSDDDEDEDVGLGAFGNGIVKGDVEASDSSEAEEGLFDDEAEETDEDEEEDDSEDEDDE